MQYSRTTFLLSLCLFCLPSLVQADGSTRDATLSERTLSIVLGSFSSPRNADLTLEREQPYAALPLAVERVNLNGPLYRVTLGPFESSDLARLTLAQVRSRIPDAWLMVAESATTQSRYAASKAQDPLQPDTADALPLSSVETTETQKLADVDHADGTGDLDRVEPGDTVSLLVQVFDEGDAAYRFALKLARQYQMPVLIEAVANPEAGSTEVRHLVMTLPLDASLSPLLLALLQQEYPQTAQIPGAMDNTELSYRTFP